MKVENKGEPENLGCMFKTTKWIKSMMNAVGSMIIISLIFCMFCFAMNYAIYFDIVFEGSNVPKNFKPRQGGRPMKKGDDLEQGKNIGNVGKDKDGSLEVKIQEGANNNDQGFNKDTN